MEWRITFFVRDVESTPEGWLVRGEAGLGPPEVGDEFSFVHHDDQSIDDQVRLRITEANRHQIRLVVERPVERVTLRAGDILGGEAEVESPRS